MIIFKTWRQKQAYYNLYINRPTPNDTKDFEPFPDVSIYFESLAQ